MSINQTMRHLGEERSVIREIFEYGNARKKEIGEENVFDFSLGNPSVPAPPEVNAESSTWPTWRPPICGRRGPPRFPAGNADKSPQGPRKQRFRGPSWHESICGAFSCVP